MSDKISILMPSLNVAEYIEECMDSVINQTYQNLEILVIDAGSTDGTLELLQQYAKKDSRIKFIHSDKKSYGYQMNLGLAAATGDYIGIVETDDYIVLDMYESLQKVSMETDADFVKGYAKVIKTNGKEILSIENDNTYIIDKGLAGMVLNTSQMPELLAKDKFHWLGLYKEEFLKTITFHETAGAAFQDQGFLLKTISSAKKAVYIDKPVYYYRQSNSGSSIFNTKGFFYILQEYGKNESYVATLSKGWIEAFYQRMLEQVEGRYYVMAIANKFWMEATEDIDAIRAWLKRATEEGYLTKDTLSKETFRSLQLILKDRESLYLLKSDPVKFELAETIEKMNASEYIWIYGAGVVGKIVATQLQKSSFTAKVQGFVVTQKGEVKQKIADNDEEEYIEQYPIKSIKEVHTPFDKTLFLVAVSQKFQSEVIQSLEEHGFENYVFWNNQLNEEWK